MACKGCLEFLLKLLNVLMALVGLAMVGYGIYLFVEYKNSSSVTLLSLNSGDPTLMLLARPMLMAASPSGSIFDDLPKAWFIYLFIGVGVILFVISCCGCIGAATRSGCCLCSYSVLVFLLILVELGCAAFIFFDKSWEDDIPTDKTGDFDMIYDFLKENWAIAKWVALGVVILEVQGLKLNRKREPLMLSSLFIIDMACVSILSCRKTMTESLIHQNKKAFIFLLALLVRAANKPAEYDSDDELIAPRQQIRQPLLNRPPDPPTGGPVAGALDQRPSRNDAWSTRMREKYGLDTSEFTYNPSDPQRFQQVSTQPAEERRRCTIL